MRVVRMRTIAQRHIFTWHQCAKRKTEQSRANICMYITHESDSINAVSCRWLAGRVLCCACVQFRPVARRITRHIPGGFSETTNASAASMRISLFRRHCTIYSEYRMCSLAMAVVLFVFGAMRLVILHPNRVVNLEQWNCISVII